MMPVKALAKDLARSFLGYAAEEEEIRWLPHIGIAFRLTGRAGG
jgi:hypothetical protein